MFRLSAKRVFLTYPQIGDITHDEIHQHLSTFGDTYSALEYHEDGQPHIHAIVTSHIKFNIRSSNYFDYRGKHPNIQSIRDVRATSDYVGKGGATKGEPPGVPNESRAARLTTLLNESGNYEEFIRGYESIDPYGYINNYDRIRSFGTQRYESRSLIGNARERTEFKVPPEIEKWVQANLFPQPERPKCLVLIGGTRLGKTEWARSLGTHHYYPNTITTDRTKGARYCVIDDMDAWDKFPYKKQFFGCHKQIGLCLKYQKPEILEWGIPTIWLWNPENAPFEVTSPGYYNDNCNIVTVTRPLFWPRQAAYLILLRSWGHGANRATLQNYKLVMSI